MINEVFVIKIDKNGQILSLDFVCLEIFFFFPEPGRLVDLCLFHSTTIVMSSG